MRFSVALTLLALFSTAGCGETPGGGETAEPGPRGAFPALLPVRTTIQVEDLAWSADGRRPLAVSGTPLSLRERSTSGRLGRRLRLGRSASTAAVSPDGRRLAEFRNGRTPRLVLRRVADGTVLARSAPLPAARLEGPQIIWSPDGRRVLVGVDARRRDVRILGALDGRPVAAFDGPAEYLDRELFSPHGSRIALPGHRGVALTDVRTRTRRIVGRRGDSAAWSPDGRRLVLGRIGGDVLLDLATGMETPLPTREPVWAPDGKRLAWFPRRGAPRRLSVSVVTLDAQGHPGATMTRSVKGSPEDGYLLRWSPDGRGLAVSTAPQV